MSVLVRAVKDAELARACGKRDLCVFEPPLIILVALITRAMRAAPFFSLSIVELSNGR